MRKSAIALLVILSLAAPLLASQETDKGAAAPAASPAAVNPAAADSNGKAKENAAVPAQGAQKGKLKQNPGQSDTFEVEADKLDVYKTKGEAFFQGNVKATRPDMLLKSNTLRLVYDNKTKKVSKMTATGNVSIHWKDLKMPCKEGDKCKEADATCKQAIYYPDDSKMILIGNVLIIRGDERITGEQVTLNMKEGDDHQIVQGSPGSRVKVRGKIGQGTEVPW